MAKEEERKKKQNWFWQIRCAVVILTAKVASTSQLFYFAILFCSKFSPSHVLLKVLSVFLLFVVFYQRLAHDRETTGLRQPNLSMLNYCMLDSLL